MLFNTHGHPVLTMLERHSRILITLSPLDKGYRPIASVMPQVLGQLPTEFRRIVIVDNGTEFGCHHQLHAIGIETFLYDTHSP